MYTYMWVVFEWLLLQDVYGADLFQQYEWKKIYLGLKDVK